MVVIFLKIYLYQKTIKYDPVFFVNEKQSTNIEKLSEIAFDDEYQNEQAKKMFDMVKKDQRLAIGMAKEYIEACLQTILRNKTNLNVEKLDLPSLMSECRKVFELNNSDNSEVKKIITGLSSTLNGICELRNHKGSGHAHSNLVDQPTEIQAKLAVDSVITIANFYWGLFKKETTSKL